MASNARPDYPLFDCDNHYYEAHDAFTRHLEPGFHARGVQWVELGGRQHHLVGGRLSHAVSNPTFDPIAMPGALHGYFRGNPEGRPATDYLRAREPIPAHYRNRDARLAVMDAQGLEAMWLFPTLGILYEELLKDDLPAAVATFRAFNRWLDDDWGFAYKERIFAAPYIVLSDVQAACDELEWALGRGARIVVMRPAAVNTADGPRSPADACFDPFWARVAEAGITVVAHAGDSGYTSNGYAEDGFSAKFGGAPGKPSIKMLNIERAAHDFLMTLILERLFERFPRLRLASVENGSQFLRDLQRKLQQSAARMPGWYQQDPVDTLRRHVWINPFWEDDVDEVRDLMGTERVIFGSDWPHIEGMPQPLDYLHDINHFDPAAQRAVLRDNTRLLNLPVGT